METKCDDSVGTFEGHRRFVLQESVQLLPEPQKASLAVLVSTESYFPEHFHSLKEQIIGAVVEECKDGYVVLRKGAVLPQVPPQNKATLLGCQ